MGYEGWMEKKTRIILRVEFQRHPTNVLFYFFLLAFCQGQFAPPNLLRFTAKVGHSLIMKIIELPLHYYKEGGNKSNVLLP